ncbi:hypothetical protein COOONC_24568 [Cooperia oncophora]
MPLHFFRTTRRSKNVVYIRQDPRRILSVNQSLIRQRFRFTDDQLDWITELWIRSWALMAVELTRRSQCEPPPLVLIRTPAPTTEGRVCIGGFAYLCHHNAYPYCSLSDTGGCCQKTVSNIIRRVVDALNFKTGFEPVAVPAKIRMSSQGQERCPVGRILYVNTGSPGSVHDATVWRNSSPAAVFNSGGAVGGYRLLGDSGYANGSGIITPFRPTAIRGDARKTRYNREHCRMRAIVEMTIGRLKSRFPILSSELRVGPQQASKIVLACAVLHNISLCLNACGIRQLGRRKATMVHPRDDVEDVRAYIVERL